jgi:hypothetical protein
MSEARQKGTEGWTRTQRLAARLDQRIDSLRLKFEPRGNVTKVFGSELTQLFKVQTPDKEFEVPAGPFLGGAIAACLSRR